MIKIASVVLMGGAMFMHLLVLHAFGPLAWFVCCPVMFCVGMGAAALNRE